MKNRLCFMNKDDGFVLPYILFISTLIFIVLSANINIYVHDQKMTEQHIERLKIETIIQLGRSQLKNEIIQDPELQSAYYTFPDGQIKISITNTSKREYDLHMTIETKKGSSYKIRNHLPISNVET